MAKQSLLDDQIKTQIREVFAEMKSKVLVLFFKSQENSDDCADVQQLLEELAGLTEQLSLSVYDLEKDAETAHKYKVARAPTFVLARKNGDAVKDYGIRFVGAPFGHEFSALIHDILLVSKGESGLNAETVKYLAELKEPVLLQVFSTPT